MEEQLIYFEFLRHDDVAVVNVELHRSWSDVEAYVFALVERHQSITSRLNHREKELALEI